MLDVIAEISAEMDPGSLNLCRIRILRTLNDYRIIPVWELLYPIAYSAFPKHRHGAGGPGEMQLVAVVSVNFSFFVIHQGLQVWKWPQLFQLSPRNVHDMGKDGNFRRGYALRVCWTYSCCEFPEYTDCPMMKME